MRLRRHGVLEPSHAVFRVKGVTAIPLDEKRASTILNVLRARRETDPHMSLMPEEPAHAISVAGGPETSATSQESQEPQVSEATASPHVQFSDRNDVKVMSPLVTDGFEHHEGDEDSVGSRPSTVASTPTSEFSVNTDTVVKTLADRLSFWNKNRTSRTASVADPDKSVPLGSEPPDAMEGIAKQAPLSLDSIIQEGGSEPSEVIDTILAAAAPPPPTTAEKHSQIQEKIVRDCIREFTRGGMYFAYTFGAWLFPYIQLERVLCRRFTCMV